MARRKRLTTIDYPSPNFNSRGGQPVQFLILHYTATASLKEALDILTSPSRPVRVSAHYVVAENGDIYSLVKEQDRAWHAGNSYWGGQMDLNSTSIGIEIQNQGDLKSPLPEFPAPQVNAVLSLSQAIVRRHKIRAFNVLGHSDVAPDRKPDPGEKFPWSFFASQNVGVYPSPLVSDYDSSANWDEAMVLAKLRAYGYKPGIDLKTAMSQFQRHFNAGVYSDPANVGIADAESKARLACLLRRKAGADRRIANKRDK